jgi:predicted anti-sigma-YlaC factor YlaD
MPEIQTANITAQYTPEQLDKQINLEKRKWENRRRMAWVALVAIIVQTLLLILLPVSLLSLEKIQVMKEPLTWAYWCESAIILAYMGFTTWAYINDKSKTPSLIGE